MRGKLFPPYMSSHSPTTIHGGWRAGHVYKGRWEANQMLQHERHSYEKCQYEEFKKRVAKMDELRASKGGARSN